MALEENPCDIRLYIDDRQHAEHLAVSEESSRRGTAASRPSWPVCCVTMPTACMGDRRGDEIRVYWRINYIGCLTSRERRRGTGWKAQVDASETEDGRVG